LLDVPPALPNRPRSSARSDSTPVSENISSDGSRRANRFATPVMAAVREAACLLGGTEVRRIQMATSAHHERKPVGPAKGGALAVVLETAATAAAKAASSMTAVASSPVLREGAALAPPAWQPVPEWSLVAPRGTTAGVPAAVVLTADAASPVWKPPEGAVPPGESSPAVAAGLAP